MAEIDFICMRQSILGLKLLFFQQNGGLSGDGGAEDEGPKGSASHRAGYQEGARQERDPHTEVKSGSWLSKQKHELRGCIMGIGMQHCFSS